MANAHPLGARDGPPVTFLTQSAFNIKQVGPIVEAAGLAVIDRPAVMFGTLVTFLSARA